MGSNEGDSTWRSRTDPGQRRRPRRRAARRVRGPGAEEVRGPRAEADRHATTAPRRGTTSATCRQSVGLNAVVGRPPEDYGLEPAAFSDMRKGCYDIHERVRDMNANGVLGSLCFPSWPGFAATAVPDDARQGHGARVAAGVQRLAHRRVVRRRTPAGSSRSRLVPIWDPRADGRRSAPTRGEGLSRGHVLREPGASSACRACTPTTGTRSGPRAKTSRPSSACTSARRRSSSSPPTTRRSTC